MEDILINVTQLAQKLGLARSTVHYRLRASERQAWAHEDLLPRPAKGEDAPYRWRLSAVDAWLAKRPLRRVV